MKRNGQKLMAKVEPKLIVDSENSISKPSKTEENVHKMPCGDIKLTESRNKVILNSETLRRSGRKIKLTEKMKEANSLLKLKKTVIMRCSIKSCKKPKSDGYSLHTFPKNKSIFDKWITNCYNHIDNIAGSKRYLLKVCGRHFEDCLFPNPNNKYRLLPNAVPTLFHNSDKSKTTKPSSVTAGTSNDLPTECNSPNRKIIDVAVPLTSSSIDIFVNDSVSPTDKMKNHNQDITNSKSLIKIVPLVSTPGISQNDDSLLENVDKTNPPAEVLIVPPSLGKHHSSDTTNLEPHTPDLQTLESIDSGPTGCQLYRITKSLIKIVSPISTPEKSQNDDSLLEHDSKTIFPADVFIKSPSIESRRSSNATYLDLHTPDTQILEPINGGPNDDYLLENVDKTILPADVFIKSPSVESRCLSNATDLDPNTPDLHTLKSIDSGLTGCQLDSPIGQRKRNVKTSVTGVTIVGTSTGVYKQFADLYSKYLAVLLPRNWKVTWYDSLQTIMYHHTGKQVTFYCLTPSISIFENNFVYGRDIKSRLELELLLEQIDILKECFGNDRGFNPHCVGYYDGTVELMCCKCLEWIEDHNLFKNRTATCHNHPNLPDGTPSAVIDFENPSYDDIDLRQMMHLFSMDQIRDVFNSMFGTKKS